MSDAKVEIIRTDGTREQHSIPKNMLSVAIRRSIGADTLDCVRLPGGRVMLVDDNGWETEMVDHGGGHFEMKAVKARKPINAEATALYHSVCHPGTTHEIVGDVAIADDEDFA